MKKIARGWLVFLFLLSGFIVGADAALGGFVIDAQGKNRKKEINWADSPNSAVLKLWGNQTGQGGPKGIDQAIANWLGITRKEWKDKEVYKSDHKKGSTIGDDSGAGEDYYSTAFSSAKDPNGATITWNGPSAIVGATYLLVKGGKGKPSWYLFDIGGVNGWNGVQTIELKNFWAGAKNSISHVTLYEGSIVQPPSGSAVPIPEPSSSMLILLGLTGFSSGIFRFRARR